MTTAAATAATGAPTDTVLPKKEQELFRTVVNCYETKNYKKGMKNAEIILKKYPNHGETLAMKGLITNCLGQKAEAYELVKLGVRNGVKSHICWHVFGLLHKSDKNLKEASKCYLNALRIDPYNQNILRDLSALQVQIRDIPGFVLTRRKILDTKPTVTSSWVAFAAGNYLGGEYSVAYDVIAKFFEGATNEKTSKSAEEKHAESELILFQNRCLEKQSKFDEAIIHLRNQQGRLVDGLSFRVKQAELLVLAGRFNEARVMWILLVRDQGENYRFHTGLQTATLELDVETSKKMFQLKRLELPSTTLPLSDDQKDKLLEMYNASKCKSRAISKIYLTITRGEHFKMLLEEHIRKSLHDEVPALYQDILSLIRDPGSKILKDPVDFKAHPTAVLASSILDKFLVSLKSDSFDLSDECSPREAPGVMLWGMFLKSHLLLHCGEVTTALAVIDECLLHTPTALDMYTMRARLLKISGDAKEAASVMDYCRSLDLQDRYLNNKATKYFLRADHIPEGMETIAMFTKHEGDAEKILFDLQANWYEAELGESYARTKQWGPALKKFYAIQKHFQDYIDDMSDFHGFCLRKQTLRSYCDVLAMQDSVYSHPFLQRAARGAMSILLHLIDCPEDIDGLGHLSSADRKKEKTRLKKRKEKELKAFEDKEKAQVEEAKWNGKDSAPEEQKDLDPFGEKILQKNYLAECSAWCTLVAPFRVDGSMICSPDTLALVCDVMIRRGKYVPAARALSVGLKSHPNHPALSVMLVKFASKVGGGASSVGSSAPLDVKPLMQSAVSEELSLLLGPSVSSFSTAYSAHARESNSVDRRIAAAKICVAADKGPTGKAQAVRLIVEKEMWAGRGVTAASLQTAMMALRDLKVEEDSEDMRSFRARAAVLYPLSLAFGTPIVSTLEA